MSKSRLELALCNEAATEALGATLARAYNAGPGGIGVIYLQGELGAGKTTCARSLLRALGADGTIRSPTYTLLETYCLPAALCVHLDLYRLSDAGEVDELGLRDYLEGDCLLLVEWPERGGVALPAKDLDVTLLYVGESRRASIEATTNQGRIWLDYLSDDASLRCYVSHLT